MKFWHFIGFVFLLAPFNSRADLPAEDQYLYANWISSDILDIHESGNTILGKKRSFNRIVVKITHDNIIMTGNSELTAQLRKCGNPRFEPRLWSSLAYSRLAEYDFRTIIDFWHLSYNYNVNRVYRIACSGQNVPDLNYQYGVDEVGSKSPPQNMVPFDLFNIVIVSKNRIVIRFNNKWILLRKYT